MVAGRRVTDDAALEVAKMVYAGQLNVDLLAALRAHRVQAVGLSGVDADLITAHTPAAGAGGGRRRRRPSRWTTVTSATSTGWIPRVLLTLMEARFVPVVASLAGGEDGEVFNVNADTVAEIARGRAPGAEADLPHRRARRAARSRTIPRRS